MKSFIFSMGGTELPWHKHTVLLESSAERSRSQEMAWDLFEHVFLKYCGKCELKLFSVRGADAML